MSSEYSRVPSRLSIPLSPSVPLSRWHSVWRRRNFRLLKSICSKSCARTSAILAPGVVIESARGGENCAQLNYREVWLALARAAVAGALGWIRSRELYSDSISDALEIERLNWLERCSSFRQDYCQIESSIVEIITILLVVKLLYIIIMTVLKRNLPQNGESLAGWVPASSQDEPEAESGGDGTKRLVVNQFLAKLPI